VRWPGHAGQTFGLPIFKKLQAVAKEEGVDLILRARTTRHRNEPERGGQNRHTRLVLLGPRTAGLAVALLCIVGFVGLWKKRLKRQRWYLAAAAGDSDIHEPDDAKNVASSSEDEPEVVAGKTGDGDQDQEMGGQEQKGRKEEGQEEEGQEEREKEDQEDGQEQEETFGDEFQPDWGGCDDADNVGPVVSSQGTAEEEQAAEPCRLEQAAVEPTGLEPAAQSPAGPEPQPMGQGRGFVLRPCAQARFFDTCRAAVRALASMPSAGSAALAAELEVLLDQCEGGHLAAARRHSPCDLRLALCTHSLGRDYQVKVALPLQCLAVLVHSQAPSSDPPMYDALPSLIDIGGSERGKGDCILVQ